MTPFVSVILFKRDGKTRFKLPRKEQSTNATHARKAAMRYWNGTLAEGERFLKLVVVREEEGQLQVAERARNAGSDKPWITFPQHITSAAQEPHLAACLEELGIDQDYTPPMTPDVLVINGSTYRREI